MEEELGNGVRLPDYSVSEGRKPYQFLSSRQSMNANKFSRKNREGDEHARLGDVESPGSEDAVCAKNSIRKILGKRGLSRSLTLPVTNAPQPEQKSAGSKQKKRSSAVESD